jgi:hypothetical protein
MRHCLGRGCGLDPVEYCISQQGQQFERKLRMGCRALCAVWLILLKAILAVAVTFLPVPVACMQKMTKDLLLLQFQPYASHDDSDREVFQSIAKSHTT